MAAILVVFGVAFSGSAAAQINEAIGADELEVFLTEAGLAPEMSEDAASGAPVAKGQAGEFTFWVRGLDCAGDPARCETFMFFSLFDLGRAPQGADFLRINHFNDSQVFGRAYVVQGRNQIGVDYVVEMGGGVTRDHLQQNIGRWPDVIDSFVNEFRNADADS